MTVDAEQLTSSYLLTRSNVTDVVERRVFTAIPGLREGQTEWRFPMVRLGRIGGAPVLSRPRMLDRPVLQVEAYGDRKAATRELLNVVLDELAVMLGTIDVPLPDGSGRISSVVTDVQFGDELWLPDDSFNRPQPRYLSDVTLTTSGGGSFADEP